jgi:hypothetical protein
MELLHGRFSRRSSFRWAASLGLAATLTLPALPAAAQPEVGTTPIAATPANCVIQLSVGNPNPGDQEIPRSLVMNGHCPGRHRDGGERHLTSLGVPR